VAASVDSPRQVPESEPVIVAPPEPPLPTAVELGLVAEIVRLRDENAALTAQVAAAASRLARLRRDVLEASEPELVRLAVAVAERVVGRELSLDPTLIVAWARDAIQALASKDEVVIAIARDVNGQVPAEAWAYVEVKHLVTTDPLLSPGSVEVRTSEGTIAAGGQARLDAVAQAIGAAGAGER
jgi:flagellar biosynthesis/type III secretory pathway protein FliH